MSKPNYETESDNPLNAEKVSFVDIPKTFTQKLAQAELRDNPRFGTPSQAPQNNTPFEVVDHPKTEVKE